MTRAVLVTGGSGLLGREIIKAFERKSWKTVGTGLTRTAPPSLIKLDLLDEANIRSVLDEVRPNVIVHAAANRFPDSVSANPEAASALNVTSTRTLTKLAKEHNALLIYVSTDYVFPGRKGEAPYKVDDKPDPPNAYGRTKYEGELAVLEETKNDDKVTGVVLRVPLLYGHCEADDKSKSAVHPLVDAIWKAQEDRDAEIQIDDYALRFPTCTEDVGRVLADIAELYSSSEDKNLPKILQFSAQEQFTKYQMVKILGEILGLPIRNLVPHDPTKDEAQSATQRPYDSKLDISVLKDLGIDYSCQDFTAWWRKDFRAFRK